MDSLSTGRCTTLAFAIALIFGAVVAAPASAEDSGRSCRTRQQRPLDGRDPDVDASSALGVRAEPGVSRRRLSVAVSTQVET